MGADQSPKISHSCFASKMGSRTSLAERPCNKYDAMSYINQLRMVINTYMISGSYITVPRWRPHKRCLYPLHLMDRPYAG
jgi:hypothetical protein